MTTAASEASVRAVIETEIGEGRLSGVGAAEPLLRGGIVTSIELVSVLVALERRFGLAIPTSATPTMSIASIVQALGGQAGPAEPEPSAASRSLRRAARRPALLIASFIVCFLALDVALRRLVEGPLAAEYRAFVEEGKRLYAFSGSFSQDSFRLAMDHHEINDPAPAGGIRVGVFGDCGTMGSFVGAGDAIPARLEAALRAGGLPATVYNLAYYGRLLPKDYMLLELVWDRPLDVVVFTLSDDHLRRSANAEAIERYRHVTFNWELFARFEERLPAKEQPPFRQVLRRLRRADLSHQGPIRRWAHETLAIQPYQPFLRYLLTVRWLPAALESSMREEMTATRKRRVALSDPSPPLPPALQGADLDRSELRMLASVIRLLQRRGVRVLLYVEPVAPRELRVDRALSAASVAARLARETGSLFVDQSWALGAGDFLDSLAHFTPDANGRIGEALAQAIRSGQ